MAQTSNKDVTTLLSKDRESESSISTVTTSQKKPWCSLLAAVLFIGFGIAVPILAGSALYAVVWFLGLPMIYLLLQYIWLRLCRDPFLSQSDTLGGVTWESFTSCPPKLQRTVPTLLFWTFVALCFAGAALSITVENDSLEPIMFNTVTYSGLVSLLVLASAIWAVDALYLMYLFVVADKMQGRRGAAQDWWYRNKVNSRADGAREILAPVTSGNSEMPLQEDAESEKLQQLNQNRTSAKWRLVVIIALYVFWTVWSAFAAYGNPHILEVNVPVPKLPAQCDGYRLAMAADLHVGSMAGLSDARWMVDNLNALEADAIVLVGDIGDRHVNDIMRKKMAPLVDLKAPDGVYMSFGNHENMEGVEGYRKLLREESPFAEKIVLLENEHAMLSKDNTDGCSIALVGMADWSGSQWRKLEDQVAPDFTEAIRSQPGPNGTTIRVDEPVSSDLPMIMMQHQPHGMKEAAMNGVGLQLSGHTHGGQVWPQHITLLGYDGIAGLAEFDVGSPHGPSYLYVTEGVVGWGPRLRFLSQTDITVLTLRTPEAMKADGLEPDLSLSVATFSMYFAVSILPISLLLCLVPVCCWTRKWCKDRSVDSEESEGMDVEGGKRAQN